MAEFIINEKTIEIPDGWTHVTFDRFLGFAKICKTLEERDVVKDKESDIGLTNALKDLEDNTKILSYWCQLPDDEISMISLISQEETMKEVRKQELQQKEQ